MKQKRSYVSICSNSLNSLNQFSFMTGTNRILGTESPQMKIFKNKPAKYMAKLLIMILPMAIVPMVSYDFLIFYFKHSTVIYSSMIFGLMLGINLLYFSEKVPKTIFRKLPTI